jgi:hypothetical protein
VDASAALGCDAVGIPAEHGQSLLDHLPRVGCVFADQRRWWWIVPAGSHVGMAWPPLTRYAVGAYVPDAETVPSLTAPWPRHPRLIHRPNEGSPYTPPLPLYILTCHLSGTDPAWTH